MSCNGLSFGGCGNSCGNNSCIWTIIIIAIIIFWLFGWGNGGNGCGCDNCNSCC